MWARLRSFATMIFRRSQWERDLRDEFECHLEERADTLERTGLTREEAIRRARIEFRSMETAKEECREARGARWVDEVSRNLTCAMRSIRQHPGFSSVAAISLALGIGANLAVFGVLYQLVLSTLPVRDPGQLFNLVRKQPGRTSYELSVPQFMEVRDKVDAFWLLGYGGSKRPVTVEHARQTRYVIAVTGNYFETLGIAPALGRLPTSSDAKEVAAELAVISHAFWRAAFDAKANVVGRTLDVEGRIYSIAGVAPPEFLGVERGSPVDVYLTLDGWARLNPEMITSVNVNWLRPVARLKPAVAIETARAMLQGAWNEINVPYRKTFMKNFDEQLLLAEGGNGFSSAGLDFTAPVLVLMGLVAVVLLLACANVATLLFVRGADRVREMSIRLALGASRPQLIRQWLTECMLLAVAGGITGALSARWITEALLLFVSAADRTWLRFDSPQATALITIAMSLTAGLACGLLPGIKVTATPPDAALRAHGGTPARRGVGAQVVLAIQLAASLVLVVGGTMFARTLWNLNAANPGFDQHAVLYATADFNTSLIPRPQRGATMQTTLARVRQSPLIAAASMGDAPMIAAGGGRNYVFDVSGYTLPNNEDNTAWGTGVSPGYFQTLGMALVAGRDFAEQDQPKIINDLTKVIIINERMARHYFSGRDPIGKSLKLFMADGPAVEIIGVVSDIRSATLRVQREEYFRPLPSSGWSTLVARPKEAVSLDAAAAVIRTAFAETAKDVTVEVAPLENAVQKTIGRDRLVARLSVAFAALGIILATIGLYAAIAHSVSSRTREIGIRIAIGAGARDVMWMVLKNGIMVTLFGVAIGLPLAVLGSRLIRGLLFEVSPADPVSLGASTVLLALTGLAAGLWPARRAAKLDPSQTLRFE